MVSSLVPFVVATLGAVAMAMAFPRTNAVVLAPCGAAALFWAWFGASPKRAFWIGWLAGTIYFAIGFWWFAQTAGALIAPFGFLLALGPAIGDAFFGFALAGMFVAFAARGLASRERVVRATVPLASAAVFAFCEWLRSEGLGEIGVPFASLGFTQVATVFAPCGAYVGTYGITFVISILGAYAAYALRMRAVRGSGVDAGIAFATIALTVIVTWTFWPARSLPTPTYRVAAIQGDIAQSLKFRPSARAEAIDRYERLTREAAATRPHIIVWPETVIPVALNREPALASQFSALARRAQSEVVVGSYDVGDDHAFNELAFFRRDGYLEQRYFKRQLVPFAEHIPWRPFFAWIPWTANISNFSEGALDGIVTVDGLRFGPVICWESAFSGLTQAEVHDGAQAFIVSTDDAWFGRSAGPYQHAQIAQMRAIETGRYIVRAASTGISAVIAPDGTYERRSSLDEMAIVTGTIGAPADTVYDAIGPAGVALGLAALYVAIVGVAFAFGNARRGST